MKYFFLLLIVLLAIGYKMASRNNEDLASDEEFAEEEPTRDIKKIDLKKIKVKASVNSGDTSNINPESIPESGTISDPLPDSSNDVYSDNYGENNDALHEAKFQENDVNKYRPETNDTHEDFIQEELRKRNK